MGPKRRRQQPPQVFCIRSLISALSHLAASIADLGIASARCEVSPGSVGDSCVGYSRMAEPGRLQAGRRAMRGPGRRASGAGRRLCAVWFQRMAIARRDAAELGSRRSRRRPVAAVGADRVRHRHRVLFCAPIMSRCCRSPRSRRIGFCAAAFLLRRQKVFPIAVMIAAVAAGFAIATWKTARVAHGVLARPMYSVALTGFVETRDIRERTDRFVLRVATMESPRGQISSSACGCRCGRAPRPRSAALSN